MINLQDLFIEKNLTLALAESCTGGLISSMLTSIPGSSQYYLGSLVTYSDRMKQKILDIDENLISTYSSVSSQVALSMCHQLMKKVGSDYVLSITGYAGPEGEDVGLVYGAFGNKDNIIVGRIPGLEGLSRNDINSRSADFLLTSLYEFVKEGKVPVAYQ